MPTSRCDTAAFDGSASLPTGAVRILADYERRSLAHVVGLARAARRARACGAASAIRIGRKRLASGFDEVVEILPMPQVTPVPGAQPWMLGVANIRGNLLPIVDLKQFLEGERTVLHEGQRVLIVRQPGGDVAVTIDELFGQRSFIEAQQQPPEALAQSVLAEGRYAHFVDRAYRPGRAIRGAFSAWNGWPARPNSDKPRPEPHSTRRSRSNMSTVMDTVAGKGRNLGTNVWSVAAGRVAGRLRRQHRLRDHEGGAPGRCQYRGLEPAGELAEARQPGP